MRQFRVRNLLVQLMPDRPDEKVAALMAAEGCTAACSLNITDYTKGCCGGGCSDAPSGTCLPCTNITDAKRFSAFRPADLAVLKVHLRAQLDEITAIENSMEEGLRIRSQAEAQLLEEQLSDALEHVRELRKGLPKEAKDR